MDPFVLSLGVNFYKKHFKLGLSQSLYSSFDTVKLDYSG